MTLLHCALAVSLNLGAMSPDWDRVSQLVDRKAFAQAERWLRSVRTDGDQELALRRDTLLVRVLVAQKRYAEAEPFVVKLLDRDPALADRHLFELATARFGQKNYQGALSAAQGVDAQGFFADDAEVLRLASLLALGQTEAALAGCLKDEKPLTRQNAEHLHVCGQAFIAGGKLDKAEPYLRYVVRHYHEKPEAKTAAGALLAAVSTYREQAKSDELFGRAEHALKRRQLGAAQGLFQQALGQAKDAEARAETLLRLADLEERRQNYQQALAGYERAASAAGQSEVSAQALYAAGNLATRLKNLSLAQNLFQKLLIEHPLSDGRAQALFGLGFTAFLGHEFENARQLFTTLLTLDLGRSERQRTRYWYGRALEALHQPEVAQLTYSEILRDDPAGYYAFRAEQRLRAGGLEALELPFEKTPEQKSLSGRLVALVQRALGFAGRALKTEAVRFLDRLARGDIPTQEDARALSQGFATLGEKIKSEIVLAMWRYDHLGELSPEERLETLRARHPRFFEQTVQQEARRTGIKPSDVLAVIRQESRFISTARSASGARGLMQLMIPTAREVARSMGVRTVTGDTLYKPDLNLKLGTTYLSRLLHQYDQKELAFAAYNAGPGNVGRWLTLFGDLPVDVFCELIPFAETKDYVQRVVGYARGYEMTARPALGSL